MGIFVEEDPSVPLIFVVNGVAVRVSSSIIEFTIRFQEASEIWSHADFKSPEPRPDESAAYEKEAVSVPKKNASAERRLFLMKSDMFSDKWLGGL